MAYAKLDDGILDHPKCLRAGEEAANLFIRSIIWANRLLTDGEVPKDALILLSRSSKAKAWAATLVRVGLWEDCGDHWRIHDFLDWNDSKEKVLKQREGAKIRKDRWKERLDRRSKEPDPGAPPERDQGTPKERVPERVPERIPERDPGTQPTPLLSSPREESPPPTPSAGAAGATGDPPDAAAGAAKRAPKRAKHTRPPSPDVEAVRSAVLELVGVAYPDAAWDQLRARLREGATRDDALEFLRWASAQPWEGGQLRLDPTVLFRRERFATGLAKARASAEGRMRLVGGLAPDPVPRAAAVSPGDRVDHVCRGCSRRVLGTVTEDGWLPDEHGCGAAVEAAL